MIPIKNKNYFIEYRPNGKDPSELSYVGPGLFTGDIILPDDLEESVLYWFTNLNLDDGFTDGGWFSAGDIKAELTYDQERQIA